jgi:hypothetical protein
MDSASSYITTPSQVKHIQDLASYVVAGCKAQSFKVKILFVDWFIKLIKLI